MAAALAGSGSMDYLFLLGGCAVGSLLGWFLGWLMYRPS